MEYTKELIDEKVKGFIEMYDGSRSFTEAVEHNVPFYYKRHKICIVPTTIVNLAFNNPEFRMSEALVKALREYGAKRTTRQTYLNGEQNTYVQCWIFNVCK